MDNALWISWYNLPDDGRDAYLRRGCTEPIYRPCSSGAVFCGQRTTRASRKTGIVPTHPEFVTPSTQDGAVPAGDRYILLFGAEDANVFGAPTPGALHASLSRRRTAACSR